MAMSVQFRKCLDLCMNTLELGKEDMKLLAAEFAAEHSLLQPVLFSFLFRKHSQALAILIC